MTSAIIKIKDLSKYYKLYSQPKDRLKEALHPFRKKYHKEFYALKNLQLEINKGDILGVLGRNGSGKSTLLKLIAGVLQANSGEISVKGKVTALLELGAGFNPEFTGIENINLYAKILGLTNLEIKEKIPQILDFAELDEFINQPIKTYSSGMKARLGFSIAVHVDPEILILDEVLSVGDSLFRRKCFARMELFFKAGKTIIYVSHDSSSINALCNRAILLHQGSVVLDGKPREVTKQYEKMLFTKNANFSFSKSGDENATRELDSQQKSLSSEDMIPELKPKTTLYYKDYDIEILEPQFKTLRGKSVNCFSFGEKYRFTAKVIFKCLAEDVSFGFIIKDIKGQIVSSFESKKQYDLGHYIKRISPNSIADIDILFPCCFSDGDYYIDFGVSSYTNEQVILSRGVDLCLFRVRNHRPISTGIVDIITRLQVQIDGQPAIDLKREDLLSL